MDGKKGAVRRALSLFIPCFVAVGVVIVQLWLSSRSMSIDLSIVNVLCVACIALDLAQAVSESNNAWKTRGFTASVAIAIIASFPNVISDTEESGFSLASLSRGSWLWGALLALSSVSLAVVLIRLFRWDQDGWEQHRQSRQEIMSERRRMRLELIKQKANAKVQKQKDIIDKQTAIREARYAQRMQHINGRSADTEHALHNNTWFKDHLQIISFIAVLIIVILFFSIPVSSVLNGVADRWFKGVSALSEKISILGSELSNENVLQHDSPLQIRYFANYLVFFILLIVAFTLLFLLCKYLYDTILSLFDPNNANKDKSKTKNFVLANTTPIAVLIVSFSVLLVIGSGTIGDMLKDLNGVLQGWSVLLFCVLWILTSLTSVELIRIVLVQIIEENSLLKRLIILLFASVLDLLSDILLSVISSLKLILVVTSLPELMIPEDWLYLKNRIQEKLNKMFHDVVRHGDSAPNAHSVETRLSRRHIWRRKK